MKRNVYRKVVRQINSGDMTLEQCWVAVGGVVQKSRAQKQWCVPFKSEFRGGIDITSELKTFELLDGKSKMDASVVVVSTVSRYQHRTAH